MKVLVTGATGFVGHHLVNALVMQQTEVVCAVRNTSKVSALEQKHVEIRKVNFEDTDSIADACRDVDTVIHLIGQMGKYGTDYETYYHINCRLTENVLNACKKTGVSHFIYCSTPGVLGFGKRLADENMPLNPRNDYEKTKAEAEKIVRQICRKYSIHYTIVRPDFVYGPGDVRRVRMYRNIREKKFILTTSGNSYLHPTYIEDVVQGFLLCLGNRQAYNKTFNIAAEQDISSKTYLSVIAGAVGSRLIQINIGCTLSRILAGLIDSMSRLFLKKEGFVSRNKIDFLAMDHSSSIKLAKEELGYHPAYTFEHGIRITVQWCEKNHLI